MTEETVARDPRKTERTPRRDAQRNRELLVAGAREVFAEQGIEAPLEQIARRAGLGIATLYRHFPTRVDLLDAITSGLLQCHVLAAEEALAHDDSWDGLVHYLTRSCRLEAADRGVTDMMSVRVREAPEAEAVRARLFELVSAVFNRAQQAGYVRADATVDDLAFLVWANSRIAEATATAAPTAWRRNLGLFLDALRPDGAHDLDEPPMTKRQVYRAMVSLGRRCAGGK